MCIYICYKAFSVISRKGAIYIYIYIIVLLTWKELRINPFKTGGYYDKARHLFILPK